MRDQRLNLIVKPATTFPALACACGAFALGTSGFLSSNATAATVTYAGVGSWENTGNWSGSALPTGSDTAYVDTGAQVSFDATTWNYLSSNSLLTGGSSGEYRFQLLRVGQSSGVNQLTLVIATPSVQLLVELRRLVRVVERQVKFIF